MYIYWVASMAISIPLGLINGTYNYNIFSVRSVVQQKDSGGIIYICTHIIVYTYMYIYMYYMYM